MADQALRNANVLIVEDDYWQATECRDRLVEAGANVVGMTGAVATALSSLKNEAIDVALLDINLHGDSSFDVARALIAVNVPVLFLTGYEPDILPCDLREQTVINKPAPWSVVVAQLAKLIKASA